MAHPSDLVRAYDVRGTTDVLNEEAVRVITQAYAALLQDKHIRHDHVVIGYDQRATSKSLAEEAARVMQRVSHRVSMLGLIPTPVLYHAVYTGFADVGIMITASHLPEAYNGMKFVHAKRKMLPEELGLLKAYAREERVPREEGMGKVAHVDYVDTYITDLLARFAPRKPSEKLIIDTGNGTAGPVLRRVFERLAWDVEILYEEPLPGNPNHLADPSLEETLEELKQRVRSEKGVGFALDGDADRLGVIDEEGTHRTADMILLALAKQLAPRVPEARRTLVLDVKASEYLIHEAEEAGVRVVLERTGHVYVEKRLREEDGFLAGEASGHVFNATHWYGCDDAIVTLLTLLTVKPEEARFATWIPHNPFTLREGKIRTEDARRIVERIIRLLDEEEAVVKRVLIDGIRAWYDHGWLLVRPSNTEPVITWRVEGKTVEDADWLEQRVKELIQKAEDTV